MCSPMLAQSHYVNEAVQVFMERHLDRTVIPLILAGTPANTDAECFPPALRFRTGPLGQSDVSLTDI